MDIVLYTPREPQLLYPDKWSGPAAYRSDIYPSYWDGPAAYTDYLYPDRYRPPSSRKATRSSHSSALALQPRARHPRVPRLMDYPTSNEEAFHARIRAIRDRDEMDGLPGTGIYETFNYTRKASGANEIPLGKIRPLRSSAAEPRQARSTPRQLKLEPPLPFEKSGYRTVIDLTSDDDNTRPTRPTTPRLAFQATTKGAAPSQMDISYMKTSHTLPPPQRTNPGPSIHPPSIPPSPFSHSTTKLSNPQTVRVFAKAAVKLRQSLDVLHSDKRAMSKAWEEDAGMQTPEMMKRLSELNEYYRVVEEGLEGALGVVQGLV